MSFYSMNNFINKLFANHIYLIYLNKIKWALNNLQWLICHKPNPNKRNLLCIVDVSPMQKMQSVYCTQGGEKIVCIRSLNL